MSNSVLRCLAILLALLPVAAGAEPIILKFSFFTSDRSNIYIKSIKPFVDAVEAESHGQIKIQMFFSGAISRIQAQQPQLVADGAADLAIIVPGQLPERFGDTPVMELPGLFGDSRVASLVFTHLVQTGALKGYDEFFVPGAIVSSAENIHSRKSVASLDDLKGLTIRTNNAIESAALEKLGALPVLMAINQTTEALSHDKIDAATLPPAMLFEFGVGRVATNHYMMQLGGAPTAIIMNRHRFDGLPPEAQGVIRKYSGDWLAERSAAGMQAVDQETLAQLKSDPRRNVVYPSADDLQRIHDIDRSVVEEWAQLSPHNRDLLALAMAELRKLHAANQEN